MRQHAGAHLLDVLLEGAQLAHLLALEVLEAADGGVQGQILYVEDLLALSQESSFGVNLVFLK